jgi:predicted AlkP superfamily phosphohydrolase/phosphomutase
VGVAGVVLIGLDGIPHRFILNAIEKGVMPNLGEVLREGRFYKIRSSIPEISSVAWSSTITGANPGEHGIFGFTHVAPNSYTMTFPNFKNIKKAPFWLEEDFRPKKDKRYAVINTPFTFPAMEINGVLISGFVALELIDSVFPKELAGKLKEGGYKIDVDTSFAHESKSLFLRDLDDTLKKRIDVARDIFDQEAWDVFMLVFTGTDRLSHFLWDAYEDETHENHRDFLDHFRKIDDYIGELYSKVEGRYTIAFMSDHGFERLDYEVFINRYLYEWGYLKLRNYPAKSLNDIDNGTKAFALDPGRIYLNYEGRYPRGEITQGDAEKIIGSLTEKFGSLAIEGKNVIDKIFFGKDVYHGAHTNIAPDIVLVGASGFDLKANIKSEESYRKNDVFSGKHSYHDAFFGLRLPHPYSENPEMYPKVESVEDIRDALKL